MDPSFAKSLAAALALGWLALVALWTPAAREPGPRPWQRLRPRLAILGAAAFGILFLAIAAWENGGLPGPEALDDPDWPAAFEVPARTLSSGAALVAVVVAVAAIGALLGDRSRTAARGAILFLVVLLAGAVWPAFSIPRWCAWLGAPDDLPQPLPLALYRPDCDPAAWLDAWSRALHPLAAWGMLLALAGAGAGFVLFRKATARGDAPGRESACAAVACCGVLLACCAALEFEKHAAWVGYDARWRSWSQDAAGQRLPFSEFSWPELEFKLLELRAADSSPDPAPVESTLPEAPVADAIADDLAEPERLAEVEIAVPQQPTDWAVIVGMQRPRRIGFIRTWTRAWLLESMPVEPPFRRPLPPAFLWLSLAASLFAVLFGEFHLRGRRLLRDPATGAPVAESA